MAECGVIFKIVKPVKLFAFNRIKDYVGYIGKCDENLGSLHKNLNDVCNMKDDIILKVKEGEVRQEEITREAGCWLEEVQKLCNNVNFKGLVYKDMETAKLVVKLMGKKDLKRCLGKEREMHEVVVKVMKMLKDDMENKKTAEADYKKVAEVVVEVMKDTFEEVKMLMKKDMKMAIMVTNMLNDGDLKAITRGDEEMEEIVWEVLNISDEELWIEDEDASSNGKAHRVAKNPVNEAASKLLGNLLTPLRKCLDDPNFSDLVPEAIKTGLDVIDRLWIKVAGLRKDMDDNIKQHKSCCYRGRYKISKSAEKMASLIKDDIIRKYPHGPVIRSLKVLESRDKLLHQILEMLKDDQVHAVGVVGMGGIGKTALAKEVNKKANDIFNVNVMLEVSNTPDIVRIQATIAESIDLHLHVVDSVAQRAIRLYNRLKSGNKILIILDNIWSYINLDEIGIPRTCKLLLTTRERDVCRVMSVRDINILEVDVMERNEARDLLKSQTRNQVDIKEYENVVERLLSKCGGLPHAIVSIANALHDTDLASWENFADNWENGISNQVTYNYRDIYSILNRSYKFIKVVEKRIFLLLICLFPVGSSVSIESLARYSIGLNLFPRVDELSEAMEIADTWATELISSSMLIRGKVNGEVKIHDFMRAFAISLAAEAERHKFMVEVIPHLLEDHAFKWYTAISLMSRKDYSRLIGVEAEKLKILKLRGDLSPSFAGSFFEGMMNLEVLDLSDITFQPRLPFSMKKLKKLKTLCMEGCDLGDIKQIGDLVNLLVLSLRKSFVEELPNELGELCKLRLFDLSGCRTKKIPLISVFGLDRLSKLERFYKPDNKEMVFQSITRITENSKLPSSEVLEIKVPKIEHMQIKTAFQSKIVDEGISSTMKNKLPHSEVLKINVPKIEDRQIYMQIDYLSIQNLDKFEVFIGEKWDEYDELYRPFRSRVFDSYDIDYMERYDERYSTFCRVVNLNGIDNIAGALEKSSLKALLKKADSLRMRKSNKFKNFVPQLDQEGFKHLNSLRVTGCDDVDCVVKGGGINGSSAFPRLRSLDLSYLRNVKMVCDGETPLGTFSSLRTLRLYNLKELQYVLPLAPLLPKLKSIRVASCKSLKFLFTHNEETNAIQRSFLKSLKLFDLPRFICLVESDYSDKFSNTSSALQVDGKIVFPSLELFQLSECNKIVKLWSNNASGFENLKSIKIVNCENLLSVGLSSIFSALVKLESLSITECGKICEIATVEKTEVGEQIIRFPQLKHLELSYLRSLQSFYGGGSNLEFPKLKRLELRSLGCMKRFAMLENSLALFHEKIDFPCLEELDVCKINDRVRRLWDTQTSRVELGCVTSNPASTLRRLKLGGTAGMWQVPSLMFEELSSLMFSEFKNAVVLFSSREGFGWTYSQVPKLEDLTVLGTDSLINLFPEEDYFNGAEEALVVFCGRLKRLNLTTLSKLNLIPLHLFRDLVLLRLYGLMWEYLISFDVLGDSLQQLERLSIENCKRMEVVIINVKRDIEFPRLDFLELSNLHSATSFSSAPVGEATLRLPSLKTLRISQCLKMEHFWSCFIVAPKLEDMSIRKCENMQRFLSGSSEHVIEFSSLKIVTIAGSPKIRSFSPSRLLTPILSRILYDAEEYSMLEIGNLNDFLMVNYRRNADGLNARNLATD